MVRINFEEELKNIMNKKERELQRLNNVQTEIVRMDGIIIFLRDKIRERNAKLEKTKTKG